MSSHLEIAETVLTLFDQIAQATDDNDVLVGAFQLRQQLGGSVPSIIIKQWRIAGTTLPIPLSDNGYYDLEQFVAALHCKMGRTYGWRVDYIKATLATPECRNVKNEEIQRWQQTKKVPDWAFEQIDRLIFPPRKGELGPAWSSIEYDFLVDLYTGKAMKENGEVHQTSSSTSNAVFAGICSTRFGRNITENSIKGAIDRQRKKDRLPKRRNSKPVAV